MQTPYKRFGVILGFGLFLIVLLTNALVTRRQLGIQVGDHSWVVHTQQVLIELNQTQSLITDAETGQRGYLLTDDPKYLDPYNLAVSQIGRHIDKFAELTSDNPRQQARIPLLRSATKAKLYEFGKQLRYNGRGSRARRRC